MALPPIVSPAGVPPYREEGFGRRRANLHGNAPMGTGSARKQPLRTAAFERVTVSARFSSAAAALHYAWYEHTLRAGSLPFAAPLFGWGTPAVQWWHAEWEAPPTYEPLKGGLWILSGTLRLTGEPSAAGPEPTSAAVEFRAALLAEAAASLSGEAEVEFRAALGAVQFAAVDFIAALLEVVPSFELREDGGFELREDGGREERELEVVP